MRVDWVFDPILAYFRLAFSSADLQPLVASIIVRRLPKILQSSCNTILNPSLFCFVCKLLNSNKLFSTSLICCVRLITDWLLLLVVCMCVWLCVHVVSQNKFSSPAHAKMDLCACMASRFIICFRKVCISVAMKHTHTHTHTHTHVHTSAQLYTHGLTPTTTMRHKYTGTWTACVLHITSSSITNNVHGKKSLLYYFPPIPLLFIVVKYMCCEFHDMFIHCNYV